MHKTGKGGGSHDHLGFSLVESQTFTSHLTMPACKERRKERRAREAAVMNDVHRNTMDLLPFNPLTDRQDDLWEAINHHTVTIAVGPSGVGKTLVALHWGLEAIRKNLINKVYYLRSDVGVMHQRGRGALPGTMEEKLVPLVGPVYDNLSVIMRSQGAVEYLLNKKLIEPILLEDVRGRSFADSLIIFDEAQNSTIHNVKTVLTRVSINSRVIVTGDTRQIDLEVFSSDNGLLDAYHRLANIEEVARIRFTREDVVRNSVIGKILSRYEDE
jgi:phosphate starvation-inducible PhoH-like protein